MTSITSFESFNSRLREFIKIPQELLPAVFCSFEDHEPTPDPSQEGNSPDTDELVLPSWERPESGHFLAAEFNQLALALFALQFAHVEPYRRFCEARRITPDKIKLWSDIPPVPA